MIGGRLSGWPTAAGWSRGLGRAMGKTLLVLLATMVVVVQAVPVRAQSGGASLAVGGGLRMDVETRWPDGPGYRPVRITLTPTAPPIADRTLVLEFTSNGYSRGRQDQIHVTQEIELPAGTGPVTSTLAVPYLAGHRNYAFRVGEGGREVRGLSGSGSFQDNAAFETSPRMLVISDRNVASNNFGRVFLTQYSTIPGGTVSTIAVNDLPSRWIDYSALDMVCVSIGDLQTIAATQPKAFGALVNWTAAGGNLLVFGVGSNWERCEPLQRLLELPPTDPPSPDSGWRFPDSQRFGLPVGGLGNQVFGPYDDISVNQPGYAGAYVQPGVMVQNEPDDNKAGKKPRPTVPGTPPFASRSYEMGMLVAIATDKPFDEDSGFWAWLCNHLTSRRVIWYQRHGISPHRDNPEFFRFLIEGVGKAPLNAFRVLITLFVVVIGPVNYYILRRFRRIHLLVVTVPASAAAVTFALFAYAVFSDGLGTRVRVRSVTQINQATGQTECWARLSYYSGMAPGDGLTFSEDVAVYPISGLLRDGTGGGRDLVWHKGQKLESGWLRSRTPTQYLTVRSRKSDLAIRVGQPSEAGVPVENHLGTDVEMLLLRGEGDDYYWTKSLPQDAQVAASSVRPADAMGDLLAAVNGCKMAFPPGVDASVVANRYGRQYYSYEYGYYGDSPEPTPSTSLIEASIQDIGRNSSSQFPELSPRSYMAIVRFSPEVELGTPVARPESSLHVVMGTW